MIANFLELTEINSFFEKLGYSGPVKDPVFGDDGTVYWYRKVPGTVRHQFVVKRWVLRPGFPPSYEVEMVYETSGGVWAENKFYGVTEKQLLENLSGFETLLANSIKSMGGNPLHYQFDYEGDLND